MTMTGDERGAGRDESGGGVTPARVEIGVEHAERVNLAMHQHGVGLVESVSLTNVGDGVIEAAEVTLSLENGGCEAWRRRVERIEAGATYTVRPEGMTLSGRALAERTEAERTALEVRVGVAGGEAVVRRVGVELLPFDQWPGLGHYPELTAAFITPNHPRVAELLGEARRALGGMSEQDALDGYQSGSRGRAAMIAEACFNALAARGYGYINPPASFEKQGQRVRLVDRVVREGLGTCLDLSLVLAAMWEQAGLHAVILLPEGHAIPAVWTHDAHLPEPVVDEAARIRNLIELGEVVPVEATLVTQAGTTFAGAVEAAKKRMAAPGSEFCAIDVRTCRRRGVRPLPLRDDGAETTVDLARVEASGVMPAGTTLKPVALAERAETAGADMGTGARMTEAGEVETGAARIRRWQTRLLDLSLRNRLLNFRETGRTIRLSVPDVARLEDLLAAEERIALYPKTEGDEAYLREQLEVRQVHTTETPAETEKRLLQMYRLSRSSIEETGANVLYVALGMLKWYEAPSSDVARHAPLILLPARLIRHSSGGGYRYELELSDEPLRPNVTLLEKLRHDFGIETAGLDEFPEDETGLDVPLVLRKFRAAIRETARWEVEESAFLGLFSFNKFLMWRDLQENLGRLRENRLVAHLVDGGAEAFDTGAFPDPAALDDEVAPGEVLCTRDADSTQLAAIRAASAGRTFVLEGPPGTGKSQTIANMIADGLAHGKRVLFVAEKMAALSVVRRRLEEDGLGPWCLELHSAKASKNEVLLQLEAGLRAAAVHEPREWSAVCEELGARRRRLNDYVRAMHREHASGETLYEVLGRLTNLGEGVRVTLPLGADPSTVTAARLEAWRGVVSRLGEAASAVDPVHGHALRGVERSAWDFTLPRQAESALSSALEALESLRGAMAGLVDEEGAESLSRGGVEAVVRLAALLESIPTPAPERRLLGGGGSAAWREEVRAVVEVGRRRDAVRGALLSRYREEFLELEHLAHIDALARAEALPGPLRGVVGFFRVRRYRAYCVGRAPGLTALREDMERAREVKRMTAQLEAAPEVSALGGRAAKGAWAEASALLEWCGAFDEAATVLRESETMRGVASRLADEACDEARREIVRARAKDVGVAWTRWREAWDAVAACLVADAARVWEAEASGWLDEARRVLERWRGGLAELDNWCTWRRAVEAAREAGLTDLVSHYAGGDVRREELGDIFERSYGEAWFVAVANATDVVREFNAAAHMREIARFRELDRSVIELTRRTVAARLKASAPSEVAGVSAASEMGILKRELEKKRRHLPTRRLIEMMPNLLPRLKPCFLMSPLSVAQYLDAGLPPFDLVVFDEASQIPVWDSVGAMARGKDVIVVGDSKQLPPTNFFSVLEGDEDEVDVEETAVDDMESILKECNASGIPPLRLSWHYRSRHESLIAFSNHHYYENALHTFPSPEERSERLGVTFRHVAEGVYDRGGSRTNRVEAERVVAAVVRMLRDPAMDHSIGVVTFNQAQQSLIEDLLDEQRRRHPEIEGCFGGETSEPVFVKNLENVQGDERDTIIFSVGYGLDQAGKPSMNFGPLNKEGGERRLNVAVTRARKRLIVFSSLRSDQIDLRRTRSVGVRHFKTFLDYADRGPRAIAEAVELTGRGFESGFEQAVCRALEARGWQVDTQVGCAGYRIDLAVRHPERPGRYVVGIECDGAAYHSARTARDRDRIRESVLEGLGWRIERVWSTEWRVNPERCLSQLEQAIHDGLVSAPASPGEVEAPEVCEEAPEADAGVRDIGARGDEAPFHGSLHASGVAEEVEVAPPEVSDGLPEYAPAQPTGLFQASVDFFDRSMTRHVADALAEIVRVEGPVVEELALRRLAEWFGVQRITDRCRERYAEVRALVLSGRPLRLEDGVYWPGGVLAGTYRGCRVAGSDAGSQRDIEEVPVAERANGVVHVLRTQFGLPREDLVRETARLFGVVRVTARVREAIEDAVELSIRRGEARVDGERVVIG